MYYLLHSNMVGSHIYSFFLSPVETLRNRIERLEMKFELLEKSNDKSLKILNVK